MSASPSGQEIDRLVEEFMRRQRQGENPSITEFAKAYPEYADEVRDLFPALVVMEKLAPDEEKAIPKSEPALGDSSGLDKEYGDYRVLREIGRGGMGIVYEAEQISLGRRVALKVLNSHYSQGDRAVLRFLREARAAARLHHTNIVPVFEVGHEQDVCYYAMQLITGQGLDEVRKELLRLRRKENRAAGNNAIAHSLWTADFVVANARKKSAAAPELIGNETETQSPISAGIAKRPIATADANLDLTSKSSERLELSDISDNPRLFYHNVARIGRDVANALSYAHARQVVHRDIKPSNLLLDAVGTVWVTDFGLAKTEDAGLTQTGEIVGTLQYMSPERLRGQCDARADVYGLGVTLYELLTLQTAFAATDRASLIDKILNAQPPRLRALDAGIPRDLETIVVRAMEKEPGHRYQTADDLAADLQRFLNDEPIKARTPSIAERLARWWRRHPGVATLTTLVFLLIAAIAVVSTTMAVSLFEEQNRTKEENHKRRVQWIKTLVNADAAGVPVVLNEVQHARSEILPLLRERFDKSTVDKDRYRLAVALAVLGEAHVDFLCTCLPNMPPGECGNFVIAFREIPNSEPALFKHYQTALARRSKFRYAVILLELGHTQAAREMLAVAKDPAPRTFFIHHFRDWHGDLYAVAKALREDADADFRSGLCAALGRMDPSMMPAAARNDLQKRLAELYTTAKDGGTHSASGWALRRWKLPLPPIPNGSAPEDRSWFVNKCGLTMIALPLRKGFVRKDASLEPFFLTNALCVSSREIPNKLFRQFLDDRNYPAHLKPSDWPAEKLAAENSEVPVTYVSFDDCVLFCNWLSNRDGRQRCYVKDKSNPQFWTCHYGRNGYRLMTVAEWEYACRAGSTSRYPFGDDESLLLEYANALNKTPRRGGTFLPNAWGFFDLLSNRSDFCVKTPASHIESLSLYMTNAVNLHSRGKGVVCGGSSGLGGYNCNLEAVYPSSFHDRLDPTRTFRVVCGNWSDELRNAHNVHPDFLKLLNKEIKENPKKTDYRMHRAGIYSAGGNWSMANKDWTALIQQQPRDSKLLNGCAEFHIRHKKWQEAAQNLQKLADLNPDDHEPLCTAAALLLVSGDRKGYEAQCRALVSRFANIKSLTAANQLAMTLALVPGAADRLDAADKLADFSLSKSKFLAANRLAKALVLYRLDKLDDAALQLKKNISAGRPEEIAYKTVRAMIEFRRGKATKAFSSLAEAEQRFQEIQAHAAGNEQPSLAVRLLLEEAQSLTEPKNWTVYVIRGQTLARSRMFASAIKDFSKAIQLKPAKIEAWLGRADCYFTLGRWQKAQADFAKALDLAANEKPEWWWLNYCRVLAWQGDLKRYRHVVSKMVPQFPKAPDAYFAVHPINVCVLAPQALRDPLVLSSKIDHLLKQPPKTDRRHFAAAMMYYRARQWEKCSTRLEAFKPVNKDIIVRTMLLRAMLLHQNGETETARQWLSKANDAMANALKRFTTPERAEPQFPSNLIAANWLEVLIHNREAHALVKNAKSEK